MPTKTHKAVRTRSAPTRSPVAAWLAREGHGALVNLYRNSKRVSWHTVNRAKDGEKVGLEKAMRLSLAMRSEVPVSALVKDEVHELLSVFNIA